MLSTIIVTIALITFVATGYHVWSRQIQSTQLPGRHRTSPPAMLDQPQTPGRHSQSAA